MTTAAATTVVTAHDIKLLVTFLFGVTMIAGGHETAGAVICGAVVVADTMWAMRAPDDDDDDSDSEPIVVTAPVATESRK